MEKRLEITDIRFLSTNVENSVDILGAKRGSFKKSKNIKEIAACNQKGPR